MAESGGQASVENHAVCTVVLYVRSETSHKESNDPERLPHLTNAWSLAPKADENVVAAKAQEIKDDWKPIKLTGNPFWSNS